MDTGTDYYISCHVILLFILGASSGLVSSREKCVVLRLCDQGEPAREDPRKMAHDYRSDFAELCSPKMRDCVNCT